jgi:hypothetical protein
MILESTQMLSMVCRMNGIDEGYQISKSHLKHPCTLWTGRSLSNWRWLKQLIIELNNEWKYRYEHNYNHKSYDVAIKLTEPIIPDIGLTSFAQAMPDKYKNVDVIQAYRNYYIYDKLFVSWKKRNKPFWFK